MKVRTCVPIAHNFSYKPRRRPKAFSRTQICLQEQRGLLVLLLAILYEAWDS